jgi:hypothetical protein
MREGAIYAAYTVSDNAPAFISIVTSKTDPTTNRVTLSSTDYQIGSSHTSFPGTLAFNSVTNKLYFRAPAGTSRDLVEFDLATARQRSIAIVIPDYGGIAVNSVTNKLYAVSSSGQAADHVSIFDGLTGTVEALSIDGLRDLAVNPAADRVYATSYASNQASLTVIDGPSKMFATIPLSNDQGAQGTFPGPFVVNPVTGRVYVVVNSANAQPAVMEVVQTPRPGDIVDAIEVTQSVQDLAQSVPLIAGRSTLVRVYISPSRSGQGFKGKLTVYRDGAAPVIVNSTNTMAYTDATLADRRDDLAKSVNFVLPVTATNQGRTRIDLTSLSWTYPDGVWEQWIRDPPNDPFFRRVVTFQPPTEMRLRVIGMQYQLTGHSAVKPRQVDYDLLQSWLQRAYPLTTLTYTWAYIDTGAVVQFACETVNAALTAIRNQEVGAGRDKRTHYYGMTYFDSRDTQNTFFMRGCASSAPASADPSIPASGPAGPTYQPYWDTDASFGDWYGAHELGHTLGRWHAGPVGGKDAQGNEYGPCQQYDVNSNCIAPPTPPYPCQVAVGPDHAYPYPASQLAPSNRAFVGYDGGDAANSIAAAAMPSLKYHDVMSYCDYQWLTDYTYKAIMRRLRAEDVLPAQVAMPQVAMQAFTPASLAAGPVVGPGVPSPAAAGFESPPPRRRPLLAELLSSAGSPTYVQGDLISVVGTANLTQQQGTIDYVHRLAQGKVRQTDPASPVRLRLLNAAGATIAEIPAPFLPNTRQIPGEDVKGVVDAVIPVRPDLKAVELIVDGNVAARYEAPDNVRLESAEIRTAAPPIRPEAQSGSAGGAGRTLQLEWGSPATAATAARGEVRYDVQASNDGGRTWSVLALGVRTPSAQVDLSEFANDRQIQVRVIATMGFETKVIAQRRIDK